MILDVGLVLIGLAALFVGGNALVRGATDLARDLGVSPVWIGLTVVAFGTSAPELVVSVFAAARDQGTIALGNVLGSNIANIGLILGVSALIRPLAVQSRIIRIDLPLLALVSIVLSILLVDGRLTRIEGAGAIAVLLAWVVIGGRQTRRNDAFVTELQAELPEHPRRRLIAIGFLAAGLLLLVVGAEGLVRGAVSMARTFGMSEAWIGLTVVAIGTSLPEVATSLIAARRGHADVAVGNVVGSNLFNSTGIVGTAALVRPLDASSIEAIDLILMSGLALILLPLARTGRVFDRREGAALVVVYVGYVVWRAI